jgi:hypothetical protein
MTREVSMDILELIATHVLALAAGALTMRHKDRVRRNRRDQEHLADAAREIVTKLRPLNTVVAKVVEAWRACATAIVENQHRLPRSWRHLRRSIRAALGELFGGPSWADTSYGDELEDVADFNGRWWDYALTYCGYLADRLAEVADRPEIASSAELLDFDTWLAATGRHGELSPGNEVCETATVWLAAWPSSDVGGLSPPTHTPDQIHFDRCRPISTAICTIVHRRRRSSIMSTDSSCDIMCRTLQLSVETDSPKGGGPLTFRSDSSSGRAPHPEPHHGFRRAPITRFHECGWMWGDLSAKSLEPRTRRVQHGVAVAPWRSPSVGLGLLRETGQATRMSQRGPARGCGRHLLFPSA